MIPACPEHRDLFTSIAEGTPSDAELTRYAEEVPTCEACTRELSVALQIHPAVLSQEDTSASRLAAGDEDHGMALLFTELRARRSWRLWPVTIGVAAAIGLIILQGQWAAELTPPPEPATAVGVPTAATSPPPVRASPPVTPVAAPVPKPPLPLPSNHDAVAMAEEPPSESWEPPEWEDLRTGHVKSVAPSVRSAALRLSPGAPSVGTVVALTVNTSASTALSACVHGPESGVVWRGAVDPGRSVLTRGDQPIGFHFDTAGVYRFTLSLEDSCDNPVHTVEVEVR